MLKMASTIRSVVPQRTSRSTLRLLRVWASRRRRSLKMQLQSSMVSKDQRR